MISRNLLALSIASALLSMPAVAADNPGSHQHGHAEMQLAFSADQVEILLLSPAGNILGFEHHPRTPEQHQAIESVIGWLGETPLVNTPESTCTATATQVQHEVAGGHDDDERGHDDHEEHEHGHDHDEPDYDNGAQHADITVTQTLSCPGLDQSASLTTPLTTRFPGIEDLDIAWAGPNGQGAARLAHGENSFSLGR
ncbi:ZrgA family zinc uptake protein [Marinobacter sp.]|uniref:ZrgA family zinc uptake protein n=1 Tax=Marinobacter sp. TaxID=50741 RepID=UPI003A8F576A